MTGLEISFQATLGDDALDLSTGQPGVAAGSKQRLCRIGRVGQRQEALADQLTRNELIWFAAFRASQRHPTELEIDVSHIERDGLAQTTAGAEHEEDHGAIPFGPLPGERKCPEFADLLVRQDAGRQSAVPSALEDRGWVPLDEPPVAAPGEQGLQADPVTVDGRLASDGATRANLDAFGGHESSEQLRRDGADVYLPGEPREGVEVAAIGSDRVPGSAFCDQIRQKPTDGFVNEHGALLSVLEMGIKQVHTRSTGAPYQVISDCSAMNYGRIGMVAR